MTYKNDYNFVVELIVSENMALKVTKGQICDGSISKNICHEEHNLYGKFHNCITKCTKCPFFGAMLLYY